MELSGISSAISAEQLKTEVGTRVAKKVLDSEKMQGEAAVKQIAEAKELSDQLSSGHVDTYA